MLQYFQEVSKLIMSAAVGGRHIKAIAMSKSNKSKDKQTTYHNHGHFGAVRIPKPIQIGETKLCRFYWWTIPSEK